MNKTAKLVAKTQLHYVNLFDRFKLSQGEVVLSLLIQKLEKNFIRARKQSAV